MPSAPRSAEAERSELVSGSSPAGSLHLNHCHVVNRVGGVTSGTPRVAAEETRHRPECVEPPSLGFPSVIPLRRDAVKGSSLP